MADVRNIDLDEQLARLARQESKGQQSEGNVVLASGATVPAFAIRLVSLSEKNVYNVEQVSLSGPGVSPSVLSGTATQATNLAEPFSSEGTLSVGTYAVMWRVAGGNVFYVQP